MSESLRSDLHQRLTAYGAVTLLLSYRGRMRSPIRTHDPPWTCEPESHWSRRRESHPLHWCGAPTRRYDTPAWWCPRKTPVIRIVVGGCVRRPIRPTLWNRTRTSRASAERADQLRKSGIRAPYARSSFQRGTARRQIIIIISSIVRERTSPVTEIWSQIRSRLNLVVEAAETKEGRPVALAACTELTRLRGYSAGPPRRVSNMAL